MGAPSTSASLSGTPQLRLRLPACRGDRSQGRGHRRVSGPATNADLLLASAFWTSQVLHFEWGGSLLRRPVAEILVGWHVERGYLWPYVLLTYLLSPLVVGLLLHPGG